MKKWSHDLLFGVILCILVMLTISPAVWADNFTWTQRTTPSGGIWEALAASSDCQKIAIGGESTYVYTSTDGGASWTQRTGSGKRIWQRMASSADGMLLAAGDYNGYIYTSTDGGATWTEQTGFGSHYWNGIASTSDGSKLVADDGSYIYVSSDSGATWNTMTGAGSRSWVGIAISPDGTKLAAADWGGYVYTSSDGGTTWIARSGSGSHSWETLDASSDNRAIIVGTWGDYISSSSDSGNTWTQHTSVGSAYWYDAACSADGNTMAITQNSPNGYVWTSTDGGATWSSETSAGSRTWWGVVTSSDGTKIVASYTGYVYTGSRTITEPTVTTASVTGITKTTATCGGDVTSEGGTTVTARGVCWSTSANPTTADSTTSDGTGSGTFVSNITGLSPTTTYHVRAYATNAIGTSYGGDTTFITIIAPTVTTVSVTSITSTTASSGGNVTDDGGDSVTARGVCWGTSVNPSLADSHTTDGSDTGSFTSSLTSLTPGTLYHVRAYATNSVGTSYGGDSTFTTLTTPTVTTAGITLVDPTTASGGGNVTSDGGDSVTVRGVCWGTSANPTTADSHTTDGSDTGSFTSSLTSLTPGTLYHVRAYATNSVGTSYGGDSTFTTSIAPTVTTASITSITSTTASGGGNVTDDGGDSVTARGVCWSTSADPTISDSHTTDGSDTGSFTSSLTSLTPATLYHVRAYATNSVGTSYGGDSTFTTLQTFTISGHVWTSDSTGIDSVTMSGLPGDPLTNTSGYYTATVDSGWSGVVTPEKDCYTFVPESTSYSSVTANQETNYIGTFLTYTIFGYVWTSDSTGIDSVTLSGLPGDPLTDSTGYYTATVDCGWSGVVTPTKFGYTFAPESTSYSAVTDDQETNYTGTFRKLIIWGHVLSDGEGVEGVVMNGLPGDPQTDANGYYAGLVDTGWCGVVIPTSEDCLFLPEDILYIGVNCDQINQDYTAACLSLDVEDEDDLVPRQYELSQNHPNPFNPQTEIVFGLPKAGFVTLKVYNILGQEVITLVEKDMAAGRYRISWSGTDKSGRAVSSGVYFYRMQSKDFVQTKQMLLLK